LAIYDLRLTRAMGFTNPANRRWRMKFNSFRDLCKSPT
jgi:hypothetical protein